MTITSHQFALAPGTLLMEYRVSGLLGAGAFGITYLARDTHLDKEVAIKEYLPSAFAARAADGNVVPLTQQQEQDYRWGLERFGLEARTLARFSHPNIVRVYRYFEANSTGYMVMDYERGEALKTFVRAHPLPSEAGVKALIAPLLDGLEKVHAAGFLHRDIKPDNIFLREHAGPVLIDFGAARQTGGESLQALTTIVSPGYAPFEQYTTSKPQGPWSDIYSLGGVLFFVLTGHSPPDALTRMKGDTLNQRLDEVRGHYSRAFLEAIAWSLALEESARPRDVAAWRSALLGTPSRRPKDAAAAGEAQATRMGTARVEPRLSAITPQSEAAAALERHRDATFVLLEAGPEEAGPRARAAPRLLQRFDWLIGHLLLIGVSAGLGALLAGLPAFQETQLLGGRLAVAALAQFAGSAGAVVFLWRLAHAFALRAWPNGATRSVRYDLAMPVATVACLAMGYAALLRLLGPALGEQQLSACAWGFLLGACACAIWLCMAVFSHAGALRTLARGGPA